MDALNAMLSQLLWWQWSILVIYTLYTFIRALWIFNDGLREALIGESNHIKLYHVIWGLIDIPAIILGKLFPVLKMIFNVNLFPLNEKK
jgi:hypothetical protein